MNKKEIKKIRNKINETSKSSFKEAFKIVFARSNMWILAIGVIIGGAISGIINSVANDLIMGPISKGLGFENIEDWVVNGIMIGNFIGSLLSFCILVVTLMVVVFIVLFFYKSIMKKYGAKNMQEVQKIQPSTDQLILEELKQINANLNKNKKHHLKK